MKRAHIIVGLAAVGAVAAAPTSFAAMRPTTVTLPPPAGGGAAERFGVVRYDSAARRWIIAATATERASGLTGVSCSPATGALTVSFAPLGTVGTYLVDEDDAYAGRYRAGAAATTHRLAITFRKAATGAIVPCHAGVLRIRGSSVQILIRGTAPISPTAPPTATTQPATAVPEPPPTPSRPASNAPAGTAPATADPVTPPPLETDPADEVDPADQ